MSTAPGPDGDRDPAIAQRLRFGACPQPAQSLIQHRAQREELRPNRRFVIHHGPVADHRWSVLSILGVTGRELEPLNNLFLHGP